jgi:hypothetical protein
MIKRIAMTPHAAQASTWWLQYSNTYSSQCMDVKDSSTGNGAIIQEYPCKTPVGSGSYNQLWQMQTSGAGVQFVNEKSYKCMDLNAAGSVQQWTCSGATNQQWQFLYVSQTPRGATRYQIKSVSSGKCLHHAPTGTAIYQVTCNSADSQQVWLEHLVDSGCTTCLTTGRREN